MARQPGCLPTIIPDQSAVGLVQVSDASGNLSWQPLTSTTDIAPTGLTGATAASRYVGGTASGAPASGTFALGDFVVDQTGTAWICTAAGSPGTWAQVLSTTHAPSPATMGSPGPASGGYVAWTGDYAASGAVLGATAAGYPTGSATLTRMDVPPSTAINGFLSFVWLHVAGMANAFFGAYNSSGTLLGTGTADQSAATSALQRVSLGGVTTTPADGILYIAYVVGTGSVAGGPYFFAGMNNNAIPFRLAAPFRCSHYTAGSLTALPATLNFASNFTTTWYAYGWYAID